MRTRGFVRPRLLPALVAVGSAGVLGYTLVPCGHCPARPPPESIEARPVAARPPEPAPPPAVAVADLVGLYDGAGGCVLRVDTLGRAEGCGLCGRIEAGPRGPVGPAALAWRLGPDAQVTLHDAEGRARGPFRLRRSEETSR